MGKRATMRKFKRRRQRAGFALFVSLAVVIVGAVIFWRLDASDLRLTALAGGGDETPVQRVDSPNVDKAPEAAAQQESSSGTQAVQDKPAVEKAAAEDKKAQEENADNGGEGDGTNGDKAGQAQKEPEQAAGPPPIPKPATNDLWMDIPALGLNDNYIANSDSPAALDVGATKMTSTAFPWEESANTYISAHRLGYPGTASDYQFYNLPNLALGDKIYLYDENLTVYTYEVSGFAEVDPSETWVTAPQAGRDMISLMTCIENYGDYWTMGPNWYVRYVVQADRVSVDPA